MGRFRSKLKGRPKGKRWAKGQSSSSNPDTRKFRNQAKNHFFQPFPEKTSTLTTAAIDKHNAIDLLKNPTDIDKPTATTENYDAESEISYDATTATSRKTFASEWSDCTNVSFSRFLKVCHLDSALHKQMLAILAAITEVIKQNGGNETSTEYYCALLTTMETVYNNPEKTDEQVTAILALLKMGIRTVPDAVLRRTFDDVTKQMLHILKDYSTVENNIVIRSALGVLATLLYKQELILWTAHDNCQQIFCTILKSFATHSKPKWRKAAQQAIATIIQAPCFINQQQNVAAIKCAEYCEEILTTSISNNLGKSGAGQITILHVLGLMKLTIHRFPEVYIKKSCEMILRLFTLNYPLVTTCGLEVLHLLFDANDHTRLITFSADIIAKLIVALYEYQPKSTDTQQILAWLVVMSQAHTNLAVRSVKLIVNALPKYSITLSQLWLCGRDVVVSRVTSCFFDMFKVCVSIVLYDEQTEEMAKSLKKCFSSIHSCLTYQYNTIWNHVMQVIATMFKTVGSKYDFTEILQSLAELRDSYKFSFNNELEYAVGAAIRSIGVENVLKIIPLRKDNGDLIMDRSWLLPVMKENIHHSSLKYFREEIFPLAQYCYQKSRDLAQTNDGIGSHSNELLYLQLWNLLTCFCVNPIDIKNEFKNLAKLLGMALSERKELRLSVLASIRKLIQSSKCQKEGEEEDDVELSSDDDKIMLNKEVEENDKQKEEDLAELARFDKNYLPIFFNIYTTKPIGTDEEGIRLATFETIKLYLTISHQDLNQQLFNHAIERLNATSDEPDDHFIKESILDLIRLLIPYQNAEQIKLIYDQCVRGVIKIKNHKEQKKSYRILEEILSSINSTGCQEFVALYNKNIKKVLIGGMKTAATSSHGARLRCINYIVKSSVVQQKNKLIKSTFCEALLGCKDINERCRQAAFQLIKSIGELYLKRKKIQEFLVLLLTGLTGTQQMMCGTVLALASVVHYFNEHLGQENLKNLLYNIVVLASCSSREIVATCLSFIKVYCTTMSSLVVQASLEIIMKVFTSMTDDCKRHFRLKTRDILDRLVRKYGVESIAQFIPADDDVMNKRIKNLRKLNDRKKKYRKEQRDNKSMTDGDSDGDGSARTHKFAITSKSKTIEEILAECDIGDDGDNDDDDDDDDIRYCDNSNSKQESESKKMKLKSSKKKNVKTWIEENSDEIVDFIDPSITSKISTTKPLKPGAPSTSATTNKKSKDAGFKTTIDGRLIIKDQSDNEDDEDNSSKMKKKKFDTISMHSDSSDTETEHMEITKLLKSNRKRKHSQSVKSGATNRSMKSSKKYHTGGIGIHRKISKGSVKSFKSVK